eukprot:6208961-Pleurochrysis_carterae.AAC.6
MGQASRHHAAEIVITHFQLRSCKLVGFHTPARDVLFPRDSRSFHVDGRADSCALLLARVRCMRVCAACACAAVVAASQVFSSALATSLESVSALAAPSVQATLKRQLAIIDDQAKAPRRHAH